MSQRGDPYEQEAERIAEAVVSTPSPVDDPLRHSLGPDSSVFRSAVGHTDRPTPPRGTAASARQTTSDITASGGEPLSSSARASMEGRFGADFRDVRVHTDAVAAAVAPAISARAFTIGFHIFFANDAFRPESDAGRRLLAHELTHVVQQRSGVDLIQRYDESTEPNSRLGQIAADVGSFLIPPFGIGRAIYAANCLSNLEQPMIDLTFNRWIAQACASAPGGIMHSRQWDAFGHCWIGCEGSRKCGETPTALSGTVREFYREAQRILKIRPHDSFKQDLGNQALGRALSFKAGTCFKLCDDAHTAGTMDLSAPKADCLDCSLTPVPCPP